MDQAKKNLNVLLLKQENPAGDAAVWDQLSKALSTFCETATETREKTLGPEELGRVAERFDHVIIDADSLDWPAFLGSAPNPKLIVAAAKSITWNTPENRTNILPTLVQLPCLVLENLSPQELIRFMHLQMMPKRLTGVVPVLEKGSMIVAEKLQSDDSVGSLLDKLCLYLSRAEGFELKDRITDLRQLLSAMLLEAFRQATGSRQLYPTVDFQVGVNKNKIAVNLRFPRGAISASEIPLLALEGRDILWQQCWLCSDLMLITDHSQYNEIELMLYLNKKQKMDVGSYRTLLTKKSDRSAKKENYFVVSQNYDFHVLSDIRLKEQTALSEVEEAEFKDMDLNAIPEEVVKKLAKLSQESLFLREQGAKKDRLLKDAHTKISQSNRKLSEKQGELTRLTKSSASQQELFQRKLTEFERSAKVAENRQANATPTETLQQSVQASENLAKLEQSLRAAENEKTQLLERAAKEKKKVTLLEQKYAALYKDLSNKDKDLAELKSQVVKLKKENVTQAGAKIAAAAGPTTEELTAKLKESETREFAFKQEIKKSAFKLEQHEKNSKFLQQEASEKVKLLEQKLQGAKSKELELLKKLEEVTALLKKASKAA